MTTSARRSFIYATLTGFLTTGAALPCTAFFLDDADGPLGGPVVGKSYDWSFGDGLLVVNKRGFAKTALMMGPDAPAAWTSKYGSVTFNQYGRELPNGGMNEAGLVIEILWLDEAAYPAPDVRPAIGPLQWIQYQLDNSATVEEVIASDAAVRVAADGPAMVHYFVCDARGGRAAVEFIGGEMVATTGAALAAPALANSTYAESAAFYRSYENAAADDKDRGGAGSLARFARAALAAGRYEPAYLDSATAVEYAFGVLDDVAQPPFTQWRIAYDVAGRRVSFRTAGNDAVRFFALESFDFSAATPVKVFDVNASLAGDVAPYFADYSYELNRALVGAAFAKTEFLADTPPETLDALAHYPETTRPAE